MIRSLRIRGLGPHIDARIDLDPEGVTRLSGASEVGKSTTLDAIAFVLWGTDRHGRPLPLEAIRDGAAEVVVDLTTAKATLSRSLRRKEDGKRGPVVRTITLLRDGTSQTFRSEEDWRAKLAWLGERVDALRCALVPLAWVPLAQGEGGGRPLRELLVSASSAKGGRQAVIAELMEQSGHAFRRGDPLNERDAAEYRRAKGVEVDTAAGRAAALQQQIDQARDTPVVPPPDPARVERARDTIRRAELWAAGDRAREEHATAVAAARERAIAAERWDARRAEIGDPPPTPSRAGVAIEAAIRDLEGKRGRAQAALDMATKGTAPLDLDLRAEAAAANLAARKAADAQAALAAVSDVCPCCQRPGWDGARQAAERAAEDALAAKRAAEQALEDARVHKEGVEAARQEGAAKDAARHRNAIEAMGRDLEALRAELAAWTVHARHVDAVRLLGPRPTPPAVVLPTEDPTEERPHNDEIEVAREVLDHAQRYEGAERQRAAAAGQLEADFDAARQALEGATAERARRDALVAAIRAEPSVSLRRSLDAFGDLGPVEIELPANGGAEIRIDGRPWTLASTGRLVVADVWLRAGIRRAIGGNAERLPLVIDCAQDVGGQALPTPAPAIVLETTGHAGLEVRRG